MFLEKLLYKKVGKKFLWETTDQIGCIREGEQIVVEIFKNRFSNSYIVRYPWGKTIKFKDAEKLNQFFETLYITSFRHLEKRL